VSYKKKELHASRAHLGWPPFFFVGSVLLIFLVDCVVLFIFVVTVFFFVCFCFVFGLLYVLSVAGVSGLSILDCPFSFLYRLFSNMAALLMQKQVIVLLGWELIHYVWRVWVANIVLFNVKWAFLFDYLYIIARTITFQWNDDVSCIHILHEWLFDRLIA